MCLPAVLPPGAEGEWKRAVNFSHLWQLNQALGLCWRFPPAPGELPPGLTSPKCWLEMGGFLLEEVSFVFVLLKHTLFLVSITLFTEGFLTKAISELVLEKVFFLPKI